LSAAWRAVLPVQADFDPLVELIGDACVRLIGEASHSTHKFYQTRADLRKRLIDGGIGVLWRYSKDCDPNLGLVARLHKDRDRSDGEDDRENYTAVPINFLGPLSLLANDIVGTGVGAVVGAVVVTGRLNLL
jgi:hypothetical protein